MINAKRTHELFEASLKEQNKKVDKMFLLLFAIQFIFGVGCAVLISPYTWAGDVKTVSPHVGLSIGLGGLIVALPIYFIFTQSGTKTTRHVVACAQMLTSALLIHLTGGRIETHFHVFGSLAFLMFYRDWSVILTATLVTALDHFIRGVYFPQSVFGVLTATNWRWFEHSAWVIFEDIFLISACVSSRKELFLQCEKQTRLETINEQIENLVAERTSQLLESHKELDNQRLKNIESSRLASLGEMAGGIAHEINTPLAVIQLRTSQSRRIIDKAEFEGKEKIAEFLKSIETVTSHISKIVLGLRNFSRNSDEDPMISTNIKDVVETVYTLCSERFKSAGVELRNVGDKNEKISCRPSQISQVILNLVNNSFFAVAESSERWVEIEVLKVENQMVQICILDSGPGIPKNIQEKIFNPFFTTKSVGAGTGLGLSISKGIVENHGGKLWLDTTSKHTKFIIELPLVA